MATALIAHIGSSGIIFTTKGWVKLLASKARLTFKLPSLITVSDNFTELNFFFIRFYDWILWLFLVCCKFRFDWWRMLRLSAVIIARLVNQLINSYTHFKVNSRSHFNIRWSLCNFMFGWTLVLFTCLFNYFLLFLSWFLHPTLLKISCS